MKNLTTILFFLAGFVLLTGCTKDTCNGDLGNTFIDIEFDSLYTDGDERVHVLFDLIVLESLPENYYGDVIFADSVTEASIDSIQLNKTSMELIFATSVLPPVDDYYDINTTYIFGDRRDYIDCQHPGSADSYLLEMDVVLYHNPSGGYEFYDFDWAEFYLAGYL